MKINKSKILTIVGGIAMIVGWIADEAQTSAVMQEIKEEIKKEIKDENKTIE